jgi:hypothetical protein
VIEENMSKLSDWMKKNKMDARRLISVSRSLEGLQPEDRKQKALRAKVKGGAATDEEKEKAKTKPRSGRPVTPPMLARALQGTTVPGPAKTRILRAVNAILETKKKTAVQLKELF